MKKEIKIKINKEDIIKHNSNKYHLDAVQKFPARVVESKKHKKEKYPKKYLEEV